MAGSLRHIVAEDGSMRLALVENRGDCAEALEECFDLIAVLLAAYADPGIALRQACLAAKINPPDAIPRMGERAYRREAPPTYDWRRGAR